MNLTEYQQISRKTMLEPGIHPLAYLAMGLPGEAGEVANTVKKIWRDNGGHITPEVRQALCLELGDVLWYVAMLADELGLGLYDVALANVTKLQGRLDRQTLAGNGDGR